MTDQPSQDQTPGAPAPEINPDSRPDTDPEAYPIEPAVSVVLDDLPPDRLAIDPRSPFFDGDKLKRGIGIRFKGMVRTNVEEYCISQGWIRVQAGKSRDRRGQPLTVKLSGPVEAWFEDLHESASVERKD